MAKGTRQCISRISILCIALLAPVFPVHAEILPANDYFQPNFLISDAELQNAESMTKEDIDAFLHEKNGAIKDMTLPDMDGVLRPVTDIIHRAAKTYRINPKYLLVKLQKEQSLVTDPMPTEKQLDWATGYGVCDDCRLDDPLLQKFKTFGIQVDNAAHIMRWYYDHVNTEAWIKRPFSEYRIDGISVVPANPATAFLYTYTPHIHGNQIFWSLWQEWFHTQYPNGTLLKSRHTPTVYAIQQGKKHPIKNMAVLATRYDPRNIMTVSDSEIQGYETGKSLDFPNYSILKTDDGYYLVDGDILRPFANEAVVRGIGYNPDEILSVQPGDIADIPLGSPIQDANPISIRGRIIRLKETKELYFLKDGMRHPVYDESIVKINFPGMPIETGRFADIQTSEKGSPLLFKDGTVIGSRVFGSIFVIENGMRRRFVSDEVFHDLGYKKDRIIWLDTLIVDMYPLGEPIYLEKT